MSPISKLLIAYDGSEGAETALDDLGRAGLPAELEATVLTVACEELPEPIGAYALRGPHDDAPGPVRIRRRSADAAERARAVAEEGAALVAERFPDWRVVAATSDGSPASEILSKAEQWRPDLVVVGSRGRALPIRLVLGSVARRVVTHARCSVRVARPTERDAHAPARILVGHDGDAGGRAALDAAAARDWPAGSELQVIGVDDVYACAALGAESPWVVSDVLVGAAAVLGRAIEMDAQRVRRPGLTVSARLELGDPKAFLVRTARAWMADCVFVGAADLSRMERLLLGSVSAGVADRARCSVEVVRARSG